MKIAITEMFGIEYLIIQGGMHYVSFAKAQATFREKQVLSFSTTP